MSFYLAFYQLGSKVKGEALLTNLDQILKDGVKQTKESFYQKIDRISTQKKTETGKRYFAFLDQNVERE